MTDYTEVPNEIVVGLRSVCLALPETYEEKAWVGVRWRIRTRTFAHVLGIVPATPRAARAASGPVAEDPAHVLLRLG